jgi:hypothetical protein
MKAVSADFSFKIRAYFKFLKLFVNDFFAQVKSVAQSRHRPVVQA